MAFKRLTPEEFRALPEVDKDNYRYASERADRRTRNLWFWGIGVAIVATLSVVSDDGLQMGLQSALGLWVTFLLIR